MGLFKKLFGNYSARELKRIEPIKNKVLDLEDKYKAMTDAELKAQTQLLKDRLANGETTDDILPDAFAVCREGAWRVLGMKHYPVQIIGGIVLHQGRIAEMRTGEGKTLVATLPAYLNALTGKGVHIVTVNDYLARRDSEWMGKLYRFLGLTVGLIVHDMTKDEKRIAYNSDITYGTNNELGFDYLRDNMVVYKEEKVQREHSFAIVDEVDSILIDEARTPLIISGEGDKSTDLYERADKFAKTLKVHIFEELDNKEDMESFYSENKIDVVVDEKAKTATLTQIGVEKAEQYFNVENLTDPENLTLQHHINQAIKARSVMKLDIDYVVKDGEIVIVDEFTGRLMFGRRYNEGLHQAIEAKEGVEVQSESKTLATITFQNYFRLYNKLSGMTGTAMTEEGEFGEIYKLDVIEIPTNKPIARVDYPDSVYKTEKAKFNAVIEQIIKCHELGQPVLVGTISIEKSEVLSKLLKQRGIPHNVLNAKNHEKEAEIIAQAGKFKAVTIATNMAGRGTDIILGGNAEYMAKAEMQKQGYSDELIAEATGFADTDNQNIIEARAKFTELEKGFKEKIKDEADKVRENGGLFIIGTERHDSRRIDNQLRGRAGRQGDSGSSRFYLSFEDDLMRLFGGDRMKTMFERLNADENMPIENKMLSNVIESSQEKVEGRNFGIRKNVLQYDDVMNRQREIIYGQRNQVLNGEDIHDTIIKMIKDTIKSIVELYCNNNASKSEWNLVAVREYFHKWGLLTAEDSLKYDDNELAKITSDKIVDLITEEAMNFYKESETIIAEKDMRELERVNLLKSVDKHWMEHIDNMEQLKQGIRLQSYGQKDPVVEYKLQGFDMFDEMIANIQEETAMLMMIAPRYLIELRRRRAELEQRRADLQAQAAAAHDAVTGSANAQTNTTVNFMVQQPIDSKLLQREQIAKPYETSGDGTDRRNKTVVNKNKNISRNDPCPCGSGKKYKHCCGK